MIRETAKRTGIFFGRFSPCEKRLRHRTGAATHTDELIHDIVTDVLKFVNNADRERGDVSPVWVGDRVAGFRTPLLPLLTLHSRPPRPTDLSTFEHFWPQFIWPTVSADPFFLITFCVFLLFKYFMLSIVMFNWSHILYEFLLNWSILTGLCEFCKSETIFNLNWFIGTYQHGTNTSLIKICKLLKINIRLQEVNVH